MTALARYRRQQARLRELFEPFTRVHCATCTTPCCVKPARIRPVDLILVEELTGSLPRPNPDLGLREGAGALLDSTPSPPRDLTAPQPHLLTPCDYLTSAGCSFPGDLRPFGCVAFICEPMRRLLPPDELARLEAAVEELEAVHAELMAALQP